MEQSQQQEDARVVVPCNRLGRLWPEQEVEVWDEEVPPAKLQECKLTLMGKILSNPSINFQAFQNTLKRAWRDDQVEISQREAGLYVFKFNSEGEK